MLYLKFFAKIRESLATEKIEITYRGQECVEELIKSLVANNQKWQLLQEQDVLVAINHTLCGKGAAIKDGDEIAFFPPVTGG